MIIKNFWNIAKSSIFQFVGITILISFLLFFLNVLVGVSYSVNSFGEDVRERLGIYFYIEHPENFDNPSNVYGKISDLRSKLEGNGLEVVYYSQDDALSLLEDRMPDIIANFERYGIENPLPPTMYVLFENRDEYEKMTEIVGEYDNFIMNFEDAVHGQSFTQQQERVSNIIDLTNFITMFSYFLISVIVVIIVTFLMFVIKSSFYVFYNQIQIEKLMGAFYWQIKTPFLINIVIMLFFGFLMMGFYFYYLVSYINQHFYTVFGVSFHDYMSLSLENVLYLFSIEFGTILILTVLVANIFLSNLIKKV
ncbi:hypothetical protein [Candidatus Absconditicoccus praedator]|uniref:hypothetical protein n=1 Tax=Candidatus Absconditicoccus praedator TaxID=2735562 RepID=UPI001E523D8C|nr:hypothetical protein [Candidatus Absconditicoccus praedator]UFX83247.1 hypothetical protein HLG78_03910 [Candidatus Absconditicoccus praedator]